MLIPYVTQAIFHSPRRFFSFLSQKTLWVCGGWVSFFPLLTPKERFVHPPLPMVGWCSTVAVSHQRRRRRRGGDASTTAPPQKKLKLYDLLQHASRVLHSFAPQSRNIIAFPRDILYFKCNFRRSLLSARYRSKLASTVDGFRPQCLGWLLARSSSSSSSSFSQGGGRR